MTRTEPHNATCERCGGLLVIGTRVGNERHLAPIILDAAPHADGTHEAWNRGDLWLARPHTPGAPFHGSRRREHICVIPDRQLELGT